MFCILIISVSQYFNEQIGQVMTLIRKLVEAGCDLNVPDQRGERPLYQSACGGNFGMFHQKIYNADTCWHMLKYIRFVIGTFIFSQIIYNPIFVRIHGLQSKV